MGEASASQMDLDSAREKLLQNGYVVLENILSARLLEQLSSRIDETFARERDAPFDPGDGPPHPLMKPSRSSFAKAMPLAKRNWLAS